MISTLTKSFVFHKTAEISDVVNIVKQFDSEWLNNVSRQNTFDVHKNTLTIKITDFDLDWECFSPYEYQLVLKNKKLLSLLSPVFDYLKDLHNGKLGRSMLVKLPAGKNIDKHFDGGSYLSIAKRHHIPIITNNKVWFIIDGEKKHLAEGEIWEIDNTKEHEVQNLSDKDRVHLIVDIIPNMFIGKQYV
jgi:aspartyl/asparaginyl beta-hydroxylase (cupin superfamily)